MVLQQYYLGCLSHASYLIGDPASRVGAVVDPQRDVGKYLEDAARLGLDIRYVLLTHFHADFVAGHLELRDRVGAEIALGARAQAAYRFRALSDGESLDLGAVRLKILETPGHTPEAISILVFDGAVSLEKPHAVLTGDTLFIGDVGRPDLMASVGITAAELAGMLYDSLHAKILPLPDETLVYPAHGAGSACGKNLSSDTVSTIGAQRRYNYALQPMSREEFVRIVTADQPEAPAYFSYDAMLNRAERPTLDRSMQSSMRPLPLEEVLRSRNAGAQIVDVREPADFEGAHLAGSINLGLSGKFATWSGSLLDREKPIVIVAEPGREEEAVTRLGRIGFDHVVGHLDGGMMALDARPDVIQRTERITAATLAEQITAPDAPIVLDVRSEKEWAAGRIAGSVNLPLPQLARRMTEVPRGKRLVIQCQSGYRSSIAASLLKNAGIEDLADLVGGLNAWEAARLPIATA